MVDRRLHKSLSVCGNGCAAVTSHKSGKCELHRLDDFTLDHLDKWLERRFSYEENRDEARKKLIAFVAENPDLIEKNYSWGRMLDMAELGGL